MRAKQSLRAGRKDGRVTVRAQRSGQVELDGSLPDVTSFEVEDNGVGFTDVHRLRSTAFFPVAYLLARL